MGQMANSIIKRSVGAGSIAGSRLAVKAGGENLAKGVGEQAFCLCFDNHGMTFLVSVQALLCLNDLVADALELVPDSLECPLRLKEASLLKEAATGMFVFCTSERVYDFQNLQ